MSTLPNLASGLFAELLHLGGDRRVSGGDLDGVAFLRELLLQLGEPLVAARGGHHSSAFARKQDGRIAADSAGGAHNEHRLIFQGNWHS